jgi:hypothetical protein
MIGKEATCKSANKEKTMTAGTETGGTSCMASCKRLATVIFSAMTAAAMAATGSTRVISSGGGEYTDYASLSAAVAACTGGETVKLLDNSEILSADLEISKDVTLDLGGFTADFGTKNLMPKSNARVVVRNGTLENLTQINADSGAVVDLYDVTVRCAVFAAGKGTLNVYDGCFVRATTMLSSPWADGFLNIYGGEIYPNVERSAGYEHRGIKTTVYGGAFSIVPFNNDYDLFSLAEGRVAVCTNYSRAVLGNSYKFHYKVAMKDDCDHVASLSSGVYADKLGEAFAEGVTGDVVTLLKDCTENVRTEIRRNVVFDLGGHTLTANGNHAVTVPNSGISAVFSNGTIDVVGEFACIVTYQNDDVLLGEGLTLRGKHACLFNGANSSIAIDGASVETTTMCNFYSVENASFVVRGDSVIYVSKFKSLPTQNDSFAVAEGGSWNLDPSGYVTNNFVKLYRANAAPCKWQVRSWASVCEGGWTFTVGDEAPVVTGKCDTPSGPIAVRYEGDAPERKTLVADFSGLTLSSVTDALSFKSADGLENALVLTYEDGRLYASSNKGFAIIFR